MNYKVKDTMIEINECDPFAMGTDVLVCPTTPDFWQPGGLIEKLVKSGGEEIYIQARDECLWQFKKDTCDFGEVVESVSGELSYKCVYHAVIMHAYVKSIDKKLVCSAMARVFEKAAKNNIKSIGIPVCLPASAQVGSDLYTGLLLRAVLEYLINNQSDVQKLVFSCANGEYASSFKKHMDVFRQEFFI